MGQSRNARTTGHLPLTTMLTNYKFSYMVRLDNKKITEIGVYFGEGEETTEGEYDAKTNRIVDVTRYRRSKILSEKDLSHLVGRAKRKEAFVYTRSDFGDTTDLDDIRDYLDNELSKDLIRPPVKEQDKRISNKTVR